MIPLAHWLRIVCVLLMVATAAVILTFTMNGHRVNGAVLIPLVPLAVVGWALIYKKRNHTS